ncbi:family 16 glycosylhydrolase [Noviherbaspirillum pedocola]|uniref:Beta-glucanase n=1 Tax=Noviherbaspirillum pedocola TaxID=2801341 RepID=A0A934SX06_9BURK|nr:family 16 glycosylhydrolase [Noviherbaspirillum pedocola]MBK4737317.1 family 16 glycosylhydrolase [Noviherbaspirillum pedocola]
MSMKYSKIIRKALCLATFSLGAGTLSHAQTVAFADNFDGSDLGPAWQASTWANGSPFACTFAAGNVTKGNGTLNLAFLAQSSASQDTCSEVKTTQTFQYGSFVVYMKPAWTDPSPAAPSTSGPSTGTVSSFFLYTGRSGTRSHFEIDIEFVAGTKTLHTNYWVQGKPNPQDFYLPDPRYSGIDPDDGIHGYRFDWKPSGITWYAQNASGGWTLLRNVPVNITAKMPAMMNVWIGDNTIAGWTGTFNPASTPNGAAHYDSVTITK